MISIKEKWRDMKARRSPYLFVIKLILVAICSYLIIQISLETKRIEERDCIPDLQTTSDYLKKYLRHRYQRDWGKFGHYLYNRRGVCYLNLSTDVDRLEVIIDTPSDIEWELFGFLFPSGEYKHLISETVDFEDEEISIWIAYNGDPHIDICVGKDENYDKYEIQYQDGQYIANPEIEQRTGLTTEEAVEWAEKIRRIFEEEAERMHLYETGKSRKIKGWLATLGLAAFFGYLAVKWKDAKKQKNKDESKSMEQCVGETMATAMRKWLKARYLLLGAGTIFGIHMLRPIMSRGFLFWLNGTGNIYAAYILSTIITLSVVYGLHRKYKEKEVTDTEKAVYVKKKIMQIFQMAAGCAVMLFVLNLGKVYDRFSLIFWGW